MNPNLLQFQPTTELGIARNTRASRSLYTKDIPEWDKLHYSITSAKWAQDLKSKLKGLARGVANRDWLGKFPNGKSAISQVQEFPKIVVQILQIPRNGTIQHYHRDKLGPLTFTRATGHESCYRIGFQADHSLTKVCRQTVSWRLCRIIWCSRHV